MTWAWQAVKKRRGRSNVAEPAQRRSGDGMNDTVKMFFALFGGLAMFLYGMNSMSDSLQKVAGDRMRRILGVLTKNPVMGALAGALVTAVLQSSSATTVMTIGFVSAGLMSLPQAISVIFGANIGTTMTAQLIAFKISDYIYPIIFIGFLINFLAKKERTKDLGMVILSFGLLFEGIEIMGSAMKPLAGSPVFTSLIERVADMPVLGVLLGLCMTLVVQSSSATIAVLQNVACQAGPDGVSSIIGLTGAIPVLLGDNIGTTITALLASIGQSKNAKRTAVAHSFFNISGSIVFSFFIPWFAGFVEWISPKGPEIEVISRQIANAHTAFNVTCTLIWLPLLPVMVKLVTFVIRGEDKKEGTEYAPRYLDEAMLGQPVAAMYLISEEIRRCAQDAVSMLVAAQRELVRAEEGVTAKLSGKDSQKSADKKKKKKEEKKLQSLRENGKRSQKAMPEAEAAMATVENGEAWEHDTKDGVVLAEASAATQQLSFAQQQKNVESLQKAITQYITQLLSHGSLTEAQTEQTAGLLGIVTDVEHLNERAGEVMKLVQIIDDGGRSLSDEAAADLRRSFVITEELFKNAFAAVVNGDGAMAQNVIRDKEKMHKICRQFSKAHLARVKKKTCDASLTSTFSEILENLERMADSCANIAEAALDHISIVEIENNAKPEKV